MINLERSIAAKLPYLRAQAESLMVDTVVVERETGEFSTDPVTLERVQVWDVVYQGRGRVQRSNAESVRDMVVGGFEFNGMPFLAQLPLSAVGIVAGRDVRVRVTAAGAGSDPDVVGLSGTVRANLVKTHPTKRTLVCEEVSGG